MLPIILIYLMYTDIIFNEYDRHTKYGFSNRCAIAGANGPIVLTVPLLKGRNQKTIIKEVEIDNTQKWQLKHWRAIESSYQRSPWFCYYREDLNKIYTTTFKYLFDLDKVLFEYILKKLHIKQLPSILNNSTAINDFVIDNRYKITPANYHQFPVKKYPQVFEEKLGFLPNLSIIDLLFCCGKHAADYFITTEII